MEYLILFITVCIVLTTVLFGLFFIHSKLVAGHNHHVHMLIEHDIIPKIKRYHEYERTHPHG